MEKHKPRNDEKPTLESGVSDLSSVTRRTLLGMLAGLGIGTPIFQRALAVEIENKGTITPDMIAQSEWISGITLTDEQRQSAAKSLQSTFQKIESMRAVQVPYDVAPAVSFQTMLHQDPPPVQLSRAVQAGEHPDLMRPQSDEDLAFLSVSELCELLRKRQISSVELTKLYLERMRHYDPALLCVTELTEELALQQANQADRDFTSGQIRGPLQGIPWGAKDLISVPNYKTCWGAPQFREKRLPEKATVVQLLEDAGAVLVAKLSLGALAWGDDWYRGVTRNPWNQGEGSSGSSAGSACATAAALVGFSIGSETLGSIVSPCTRCGVTGLRPTFGRVSRFGCMTLAWSMDKLGPIARTVEDCALIFASIHGRDGKDVSAVNRPFEWPVAREIQSLRVGFVETKTPSEEREELRVLRELGVNLVPIRLPDEYPVDAISIILNVEAATVFDPLTRSANMEGLNRWPPVFRQAEYIPAIEYLRANRIRTLLMREMEKLFHRIDLYVGGDDLTITNLTGHPTVVIPNGFKERDGVDVPTSLTFTGRLFGEADLLALAHKFQNATNYHQRRPEMAKLQTIPAGEESKVKR